MNELRVSFNIFFANSTRAVFRNPFFYIFFENEKWICILTRSRCYIPNSGTNERCRQRVIITFFISFVTKADCLFLIFFLQQFVWLEGLMQYFEINQTDFLGHFFFRQLFNKFFSKHLIWEFFIVTIHNDIRFLSLNPWRPNLG